MKKSKYSDTQVISILKEAEAGQPVKEICRKYGISSACYYQWKSKFGGMSVSELKRTRELEAENAKLKRLYAEMALENHALKDLIEKKL
jgi:putative transposase